MTYNYGIFDYETEPVDTIYDFIRMKTENLLSKINKLKVNEKTTWESGANWFPSYGTFECVTKGERPRLFVVKDSEIMSQGVYTFSQIRENITNEVMA